MADGGSDSEVLAAVVEALDVAKREAHLEVLRQVLALRNALADDGRTRR